MKITYSKHRDFMLPEAETPKYAKRPDSYKNQNTKLHERFGLCSNVMQ